MHGQQNIKILETTCFDTFGHHQFSSKISYDRATFGARARYVDGEIFAPNTERT